MEFVPGDCVVVRTGKNISKSIDKGLWLTPAAPVRGRELGFRLGLGVPRWLVTAFQRAMREF